MAGDRQRYIYRRERDNGSVNDTTCLRNFEKWLKEAEPGDKFFVAQCRWVQCERDGTVTFGNIELPHVRWVREADAVAN